MNSRINSKGYILTLKQTAILILALGFSAVGARANLFVSDYNHDVVDQFDSSGNFVNSSSIQQPTGVTVGPDGNLYAATQSPADGFGAEIDSFNPVNGSQIGTVASHVTDNSLNTPQGMAFGPDGNLYVGDVNSGNILVYNHAGGTNINQLSSINVLSPTSLIFAGNILYIADDQNIVKYADGAFTLVSTPGQFAVPHDVAMLNGMLYVLDISGATGGIYELNPNTGVSQQIVNYGTGSSLDFSENDMIAMDGKLYVSGEDGDTGDGVVLQYNQDGSGGIQYADLGSGANPMTMTTDSVPEPSSLALISFAGIVMAVIVLRRPRAD